MKDLKSMLVEKVFLMRIGQENDNYLQYAIKNKAYDCCLYLMTLPNLNFDLIQQNSAGNTALSLAVRTGQARYVKLCLSKLTYLSMEQEDSDYT